LIYSCSNLLQMLNDYILRKASGLEISFKSSPEAEMLQVFVTLLEYIQVFSEFLAKRLTGELGRWIIIAVIQITKAVIKLLLLFKYDQGIQYQIAIPPLERKRNLRPSFRSSSTSSIHTSSNSITQNGLCKSAESDSSIVTLKRSGRIMRSLDTAPSRGKRTWVLPTLNNNQHNFEMEKKIEAPTVLTDNQKIGEVIHIIRPVAHIAAMSGFGQQSWIPYFLSLGMDCSSLHLLKMSAKDWNTNEKIELGQRSMALLLYLLRSPLFDKFTKVKILKILAVFADRIPIFGRMLRPIISYLPEWQKTYFYVWVI
ncbi:peroxisomal membrane protein PEX16-like isoform X1, partial [Leptotrombidium deliense]